MNTLELINSLLLHSLTNLEPKPTHIIIGSIELMNLKKEVLELDNTTDFNTEQIIILGMEVVSVNLPNFLTLGYKV